MRLFFQRAEIPAQHRYRAGSGPVDGDGDGDEDGDVELYAETHSVSVGSCESHNVDPLDDAAAGNVPSPLAAAQARLHMQMQMREQSCGSIDDKRGSMLQDDSLSAVLTPSTSYESIPSLGCSSASLDLDFLSCGEECEGEGEGEDPDTDLSTLAPVSEAHYHLHKAHGLEGIDDGVEGGEEQDEAWRHVLRLVLGVRRDGKGRLWRCYRCFCGSAYCGGEAWRVVGGRDALTPWDRGRLEEGGCARGSFDAVG